LTLNTRGRREEVFVVGCAKEANVKPMTVISPQLTFSILSNKNLFFIIPCEIKVEGGKWEGDCRKYHFQSF